jgi:hypothetical protein
MDLTFKIVRRLLRDDEVGFSRNRNFEAYEDPKVKRAVRIYRHLSSVEDDLLEVGGGVDLEAVERDEGRVVIKLSFAEGSGRRVSFLTPREWGLLLENERVTDILVDLVDEASENTRGMLHEAIPELPSDT